MYRNQYDTDCITWSPQGRLFQVEYAMEAVKQGSCCVAIKSNTHLVLSAIKRKVSKLAQVQDKLYKVGDYIGVAMSGITSDAKMIISYMRNENLNNKFLYGTDITAKKLVSLVSQKSQANTQVSSKRPFGVGLLVAGYDPNSGLELFETCPSGNVIEFNATAFGARCQSAKTYLERKFVNFAECDSNTLIYHAIRALKTTIPNDGEFDSDVVSVGIVGKGQPWTILDGAQVDVFINTVHHLCLHIDVIVQIKEEDDQSAADNDEVMQE
ncbi:proteasome subunit alpha type, putative [Theileria equi strain WA]|uniref:Proteasome subunit alpha type, putative n=1 Tax=Theileria equi strain WA TaxID=1537102 RepID=L1LDL7_THEEQ|nr:proteasome subunit alpha type, putative [Theileria equi strain WA]EKX73446.1 proteasome subunit alpha type, putative [Theileria equi strain WA]|eukprot:XP_004832898.1 proteasome subunit alpha type, putative [Theileria equi strain WA]